MNFELRQLLTTYAELESQAVRSDSVPLAGQQVGEDQQSPFAKPTPQKLVHDFDAYEHDLRVSLDSLLRSVPSTQELVVANQRLFTPRTDTQKSFVLQYENLEDTLFSQTSRMPLRSVARPSELEFYQTRLWDSSRKLPVSSNKNDLTSLKEESKTDKQDTKNTKDCCIFHSEAFQRRFSSRDGLGDEIHIKNMLETYQKQKRRNQRSNSQNSMSLFSIDPLSPAYSTSLGPWSIDQLAVETTPESPFLAQYLECSA